MGGKESLLRPVRPLKKKRKGGIHRSTRPGENKKASWTESPNLLVRLGKPSRRKKGGREGSRLASRLRKEKGGGPLAGRVKGADPRKIRPGAKKSQASIEKGGYWSFLLRFGREGRGLHRGLTSECGDRKKNGNSKTEKGE